MEQLGSYVKTTDAKQALPGGPLLEGYRFTASWSADAANRLTVYVENGQVHVVGSPYGTVHAERVSPNYVALWPVRPLHSRDAV